MQIYYKSVPRTNALIASRITGGRVLDVGGSHMVGRANMLAEKGCEVSLLDVSLDHGPLAPGVRFLNIPVESLTPELGLYEHILLSNVLEHLADPFLGLSACARCLAPGGSIHILSPNCESLNRRIGVRMGLMKSIRDISDFERGIGHLQTFTVGEMKALVAKAGLKEQECFGTLLKPVPTPEMIQWPEARIEAYFDIAAEVSPELCHEFYLRAGR